MRGRVVHSFLFTHSPPPSSSFFLKLNFLTNDIVFSSLNLNSGKIHAAKKIDKNKQRFLFQEEGAADVTLLLLDCLGVATTRPSPKVLTCATQSSRRLLAGKNLATNVTFT